MSTKIATTELVSICRHYSISTPSTWYEQHPDPVTVGKDVSILRDFPIHTDRTIQANRPDIATNDKGTVTVSSLIWVYLQTMLQEKCLKN